MYTSPFLEPNHKEIFMDYPGYAFLESVDAINWPLWLAAFLLSIFLACTIGYILLRLHTKKFVPAMKKPSKIPPLQKITFK
jgi:hypothetical protein